MWVVTGASGFVGSAVLEELRKNGLQATGLGRRAFLDGLVPALRGAAGVVHSAAVVHRPQADVEAYGFNVESTRALLEACKHAQVSAFILMSSIKVHGEHPPPAIDEATPVAPEGPYAESKVEAEQIVRSAGHVRAVILRLCPVYGRGDKGNVRTMIEAIARRRFFVPGDGSVRKSVVHVSTVAQAIARIASSHVAGTFVMADREAPSLRTLADVIAQAIGRRRVRSLPLPALHLAAGLLESAGRLRGRSTTFTRERIIKATTPTVCDVRRLAAAIGFDCHVDLQQSIADEVRWLREIRAL